MTAFGYQQDSLTRISAIRAVLTSALTVAILASSIVPSGVGHTHAGGSFPHQHDSAVPRHAHHHPHAHGHRHSQGHPHHGNKQDIVQRDHGHADGLTAKRVEGTKAHVHFSMFGRHFTVPWNQPSDDSRQPQSQIVAIVANSSVAIDRHDSTQLVDLGEVSLATIDYALSPEIVMRSAPAPVKSAPLCDAARLERSGVRNV